MNRLLLKLTSFTLIIIMLLCCFAVPISAGSTQPDDTFISYKGTYYYRPVLGEFGGADDDKDQYVYSDGYFAADSGEFNEHLATFSMIVSESSVGSDREPDTVEGYKNKSRNLVALLEDVGFTDIETNDDYKQRPDSDSIGVLCAHKKISVAGTDYTLLAVVPRSADYEKEWVNNFRLGSDGDAAGFDASAEKCLSFVNDYTKEHGISGSIKLWTTGFSRGGAVVNLIGKKLIDDPTARLRENVTLSISDLYVYAFAVPMAADSHNDPRNIKYSSIFNLSASTELPSKIPPANMSFDRYGTDLPLINDQNYERMISNLNIRSEYLYDLYTNSYSPRLFKPKKLVIDGDNINIVDDDASYIPYDEVEYLDGLASYLTYITDGRAKYHTEFEKPLATLFGYILTLNNDQLSTLMDSVMENDDTPFLATAMYAYFIQYKAKYGNLTYNKSSSKALAETAAAESDTAETSADIGLIAKLSIKLASYMLRSPEYLKNTASDYLGKVLKEAMDATGASEEEKSIILSKSSLDILTHFLSFMLLGNIWQSESTNPVNINNEQFKNAATLIGNAANFISDHANEIIVSWLKTYDSYYDDYAPLSQEDAKGYRRVYISAPDEVHIDGEITDENGSKIAVIDEGRLISSSDNRVGFTTSDNGDFFRIPSGSGYRINLNCSEKSDITIRIDEYTCYEAKCVKTMEKTVSATARDTVTVKLPRLFGDYPTPSGAKYNAYTEEGTHIILGDADSDGEVTVIDAVTVSRTVTELPCAVFDKIAADVDSDQSVTIIDATFIQRSATDIPVPYPIRERIE